MSFRHKTGGRRRPVQMQTHLWMLHLTRLPWVAPALVASLRGMVGPALSACGVASDHPASFWALTRGFAQVAEYGENRKHDKKYVDRLKVTAKAGDGGKGCVSFWRSAAKGEWRERVEGVEGGGRSRVNSKEALNLTGCLLCTLNKSLSVQNSYRQVRPCRRRRRRRGRQCCHQSHQPVSAKWRGNSACILIKHADIISII